VLVWQSEVWRWGWLGLELVGGCVGAGVDVGEDGGGWGCRWRGCDGCMNEESEMQSGDGICTCGRTRRERTSGWHEIFRSRASGTNTKQYH
jgi:hypothetical protein